MHSVNVGGVLINSEEYGLLSQAGAVQIGVSRSTTPGKLYGSICFVYVFDAEGKEIGHVSPDMYEFTGFVFCQPRRVWGDCIRAELELSSFPIYAEAVRYVVGERVATCHGFGTVRGFESFDLEGQQEADKLKDNGGRVLIELDDRTKWPCHSVAGGYYAFRSDLVKGE